MRKLTWDAAHAWRETLLEHEWIVTSALGGYASGTRAALPNENASAEIIGPLQLCVDIYSRQAGKIFVKLHTPPV